MPKCEVCSKIWVEGSGTVLCTRDPCPPNEAIAAWRQKHTGPFQAASTASTTTTLSAATPLKPTEKDTEWIDYKKKRSLKAQKKREHYITIEPGIGARGFYRWKAITWIRANESHFREITPDHHMTCLMFFAKSAGGLGYHAGCSGSPKDLGSSLKVLRTTYGISPKKATVCAEEHMLIEYSNVPYLFSISYNHTHGFCRACKWGCAALLEAKGIEDLADAVGGPRRSRRSQSQLRAAKGFAFLDL
jgi:hypothetical protein